MSAPVMELTTKAVYDPDLVELGIISGWMWFPDDAEMRKRVLYTASAKHGLEQLCRGEFPPQDIGKFVAFALHAPAPKDLREQIQIKKCQKHGYAAGMILFNASKRAARNPDSRFMGPVMEEIRRGLDGRKASSSKKINDAVWKRYRPVAALWATHILFERPDEEDREFPCDRHALPMFLCFAEGMRQIGEATVPPQREGRPILPLGVSVRLPDEVLAVLPAGKLIIRP